MKSKDKGITIILVGLSSIITTTAMESPGSTFLYVMLGAFTLVMITWMVSE